MSKSRGIYRKRAEQPFSKLPTETLAEYWKARHLYVQYGLERGQFEALLEQQGGCCAICKTDDPYRGNGVNGNGWSVDHDHTTGALRGLLCHHCNIMLGGARDDPQTLRNAVTYLERHSSG